MPCILSIDKHFVSDVNARLRLKDDAIFDLTMEKAELEKQLEFQRTLRAAESSAQGTDGADDVSASSDVKKLKRGYQKERARRKKLEEELVQLQVELTQKASVVHKLKRSLVELKVEKAQSEEANLSSESPLKNSPVTKPKETTGSPSHVAEKNTALRDDDEVRELVQWKIAMMERKALDEQQEDMLNRLRQTFEVLRADTAAIPNPKPFFDSKMEGIEKQLLDLETVTSRASMALIRLQVKMLRYYCGVGESSPVLSRSSPASNRISSSSPRLSGGFFNFGGSGGSGK